MNTISLGRAARVVVETLCGITPTDRVLILTDFTTTVTGEALARAAQATGAEVVVLAMEPRKLHGEELPAPVAAAMAASDVIIAPTRYNVAHTGARHAAQEAGAKVMTLPEAGDDILLNRGWLADFASLRTEADAIAARLTAASTARITSAAGSDFTVSLEGRHGRALTGFVKPKEISAGFGVEASIAPLEGTGQGILTINGSIPGIGLIGGEEMHVAVSDGLAREICGSGPIATAFRELLESKDDPNIYNIAELGIGLNPMCRLENSMLADEGVRGTIHMALGTSAYIGGRTKAAGHYDMVITGTTLELDGVPVIVDGTVQEIA